MTTAPELRLADRAVYLPDADVLVCADLHLGRDAASNVEFPLGERQRVPERVAALLERFEPAELVLAGDVLHAFDDLPDAAVDAFDAVRDAALAADADLVVVEGNHDAMLELVALDPVHDSYRLRIDRGAEAEVTGDGRAEADVTGDAMREADAATGAGSPATSVVVCHGDERPDERGELYVVGHDHPAIEIEGVRHPCYLRGPAATSDAEVLVLPAFNALAPGTVVNGARGDDFQSPVPGRLGAFRPAVRDAEAGETLWFPPLEEFRRHL